MSKASSLVAFAGVITLSIEAADETLYKDPQTPGSPAKSMGNLSDTAVFAVCAITVCALLVASYYEYKKKNSDLFQETDSGKEE